MEHPNNRDSISTNNKRIAKNTLFLYFRMILVMGVTLYTSRVVLNVLGVDDYGIYNLVGGVVVLFSFLKGAVTTAIQRYLNFAIGKSDINYEQRVFSSSLVIFLWFNTILLLLLETIGLWFLNNELTIPINRIYDTNILYQFTILTFIVNIFRIPYDAMIIAHERMTFYAYISIIEAIMKLLIVYLLIIIPSNKLILYGVLISIVTIITNFIYIIYVKQCFTVRNRFHLDKKLSKEMLSFSSWNILGGLADVGYQQGTSMILNIFHGVAFNATMGITNQVKTAIFSFVGNLLTASNPQIIKKYASGEIDAFQTLVLRISKFAFFLILTIAIPLIINMDYILSIWLNKIPPMTTLFCQLIVTFCLFNSLTGPLWTAAQAHGQIKNYQIISSIILLLNLPLSYLFLYWKYSPITILIIQIVIVIITSIYRVIYLRNRKLLVYRRYVKDVIIPIASVSTISFLISFLIAFNYEGITRFLISSPLCILITGTCIFSLGFSQHERNLFLNIIKNKIRR